MNGVTIPGVSAGSNHVGASEMWTSQVTWPSGAAAAGAPAVIEISSTRTVTERRGLIHEPPAGWTDGPPYHGRRTAAQPRSLARSAIGDVPSAEPEGNLKPNTTVPVPARAQCSDTSRDGYCRASW